MKLIQTIKIYSYTVIQFAQSKRSKWVSQANRLSKQGNMASINCSVLRYSRLRNNVTV